MSHTAFHKLEDDLRSRDTEEQKRNRIRDAEAEAGLDPRGMNDPYAPYSIPGLESPYEGGYNDPFGQSSQQLPLVANASPFQRADAYDEYDERKSLRSDFAAFIDVFKRFFFTISSAACRYINDEI